MALRADIIWKILNCICGLLMGIGGISLIVHGGVQPIIVGLYAIFFGLAVLALEFRIPSPISNQMPFLFTFFGKGLFYIFLGCIILDKHVLNLISGVIVIVSGIVYVCLHFTALKPNTYSSEA